MPAQPMPDAMTPVPSDAATPASAPPSAPLAGASTKTTTVPFAPISEEEIAAFATKLEAIGADLPVAEQALLKLVVQSARSLSPGDVRTQELRQGFAAALTSVVLAQAQAWAGDPPADGWVRIDPIWVKAGFTDKGSAIQMSATILTGPRQAT